MHTLKLLFFNFLVVVKIQISIMYIHDIFEESYDFYSPFNKKHFNLD